MTKSVFSLLFSLALTPAAAADVTSKSQTGFSLKITGEVSASPAEAYRQFINVSEWWIESHTWFGDATKLSIDPRAGGCFCEISGDREVLHMLVTYVEPGKELKMVGGLGPLQMMGIHGGMSWRFIQTEGGTEIIQSYNVTGYAHGGLSDLAEIVNAVQTSQLNALVKKINTGS